MLYTREKLLIAAVMIASLSNIICLRRNQQLREDRNLLLNALEFELRQQDLRASCPPGLEGNIRQYSISKER